MALKEDLQEGGDLLTLTLALTLTLTLTLRGLPAERCCSLLALSLCAKGKKDALCCWGVEAGTQRACPRERARTGGSCSRRALVNAAWPPVKRCESVTSSGLGFGVGVKP